MYRYYIFDVKTKWRNQENLYRVLKTLYTLNLKYINYGELLYNEICNPINRNTFNKILKEYKPKKLENKNIICLDEEITVVIIKYSRIIITSNKVYPEIFNKLKSATKNIFVCDFKHDNFFYIVTELEKVK